MATHSSILAWKIPWTEVPDRLQSMGLQKGGTTEQLHFKVEGGLTQIRSRAQRREPAQ